MANQDTGNKTAKWSFQTHRKRYTNHTCITYSWKNLHNKKLMQEHSKRIEKAYLEN